MTTSSTLTSDADRRLAAVLHRVWGFADFRPLQREAMHAVLQSRDSVVVLPTGGGKSLCFQAPAIVEAPDSCIADLELRIPDSIEDCRLRSADSESPIKSAGGTPESAIQSAVRDPQSAI